MRTFELFLKGVHYERKIISFPCSNDGLTDYYDPPTYFFKYPKNLVNAPYWESGLILGGLIDGKVRISGTYYHTGMQPAGDKRIYRVRRDYKGGDLLSEINDGKGTENQIRNTYAKDWNDWPGYDGAPYEDINKNGIYEPNIDIPGYPGAHQTIWFKANDYDSTLVKKVFGSLPLGVEVQYTYWAYNTIPPLGNTIFRKYKIINKGTTTIQNMYCSVQSDPDLGDIGDFVGYDTLLSLAFIYKGYDRDNLYNNFPPSAGYVLLRGPIVYNKRLSVSSFNPFMNSQGLFSMPSSGSYENGALYWYNLFQGKTIDGSRYQVPLKYGGGETSFPFSGNPVVKEGWLDGENSPSNNRSMNLSTGPFDLATNESQEIVFALVVAGGYDSITRLQAVDSLKTYTRLIQNFFKEIDTLTTDVRIEKNNLPSHFVLYQNYPNPFNPSTVITYQLPVATYVTLKVYDSLGREVVTLVDQFQNAGIFQSTFNIQHFMLSSGVYYYRLLAGNFVAVKKLMILK